jgi:hypothetical protein
MLTIKSNVIRSIYNHANQKIYEFPGDTLLDNILIDLWSVIIKYTQHVFALKNLGKVHDDYRVMKLEEFHSHKDIFFDYIEKNGLVDIFGDYYNNYYFSIDDYQVVILGCLARCVNNNPKLTIQIRLDRKLLREDNIITQELHRSCDHWCVAVLVIPKQ